MTKSKSVGWSFTFGKTAPYIWRRSHLMYVD